MREASDLTEQFGWIHDLLGCMFVQLQELFQRLRIEYIGSLYDMLSHTQQREYLEIVVHSDPSLLDVLMFFQFEESLAWHSWQTSKNLLYNAIGCTFDMVAFRSSNSEYRFSMLQL